MPVADAMVAASVPAVIDPAGRDGYGGVRRRSRGAGAAVTSRRRGEER
jgi:hypothetical protein